MIECDCSCKSQGGDAAHMTEINGMMQLRPIIRLSPGLGLGVGVSVMAVWLNVIVRI